MSSSITKRHALRSSWRQISTLESFYTGGKAVITLVPGQENAWLLTPMENQVFIKEIPNGRLIGKLMINDDVTCMTCSPDGKWFVVVSQAGNCTIYKMSRYGGMEDSDKELSSNLLHKRFKLPHEAPVLVMDFDATSTLFATGSADSTIRIWDCEGGFATHLFKGHRGLVTAIKFEFDKKNWKYLYSGGEDGTVRIWNLKKKACVAVLDEPHVSVVRGICSLKNPWRLVSAGRDKLMGIWDLGGLEGGGVRLLNTIATYESVESMVVGGDKVITGGDKGILRVWDLENGEVVGGEQEGKIVDAIYDIIPWNRQGDGMFVVLTVGHLIRFLSADLQVKQLWTGYNNEIIDLKFLDLDRLVVASNSEEIRVYTLGQAAVEMLQGHTATTICLDVWKDGEEEIILSGSKDKTAKVWTRTGNGKWNCKHSLVGHTEAIGCVALPKRGKPNFCLTGSQDKTIKMWELKDKPKAAWTIQAHEKDVNAVAIAPNNKLFVTGGQDRLAKLWSLPDGKHVGDFKGHKRGVWSVAFSPVDQVLATSSGDKTCKLWSVVDFSCLRTFEGHLNTVLKVDFLTLGTQICSSGSDGLVKVWNIKNSECNATLDAAEDKIWGLAVVEDGEYMATGGGDAMVRVWKDVTIEEEDAKFRQEQERVVQEQELKNFVERKDWKSAVYMALRLGQPFRLLKLLESVGGGDDKAVTGNLGVDKVLLGLDDDNLGKLLQWCRDWNTNSKYSIYSQRVLYLLFKNVDATRLQGLGKIKEILDGIIAYTERHFRHANDVKTQSKILDYTLYAMAGDVGEDEGENGIEGLWRRAVPEETQRDVYSKTGGDDLGDEYYEGSDVEVSEDEVDGEMEVDSEDSGDSQHSYIEESE